MIDYTQRLLTDGFLSSGREMANGVQQASVLGSVFRIFINDLNVDVNGMLTKFTDDANITCSVSIELNVHCRKILYIGVIERGKPK